MELSYAAYNYPDGTELPDIPGNFMGDVVDTAADVLINHGFGNIVENNYTSADCGAHTIAYRDIECVVTKNTNNTNMEVEGNDDISTFDCTIGTMVQWSLYDSTYNIGSDTGSSKLINTKQLVVVIRGSVTFADWVIDLGTQFNDDGTLSAISSTEYNHALATWAMELSYAAYNPLLSQFLPLVPSAFMQTPYDDSESTAKADLLSKGFLATEYNYEEGANIYAAHTIGYRNISVNTTQETGGTNNDNSNNVDAPIGSIGDNSGNFPTVETYGGFDYLLADGNSRENVLTPTDNISTRPLVVVVIRGSVTFADWVIDLGTQFNDDGTLSAISSTEYNHALATWAMELSYAAYNYPTDTGLPAIPGWFMGDVDYTAAELLINHGFVETQIQENNYDVDPITQERDPTAAGAHTIAYRNIELAVAENTNDEEQGVENSNGNLGTYQSNIYGHLYDSIHTVYTNTNASTHDLQLIEDKTITTRPLVIVTVRGSVTLNDWINNAITQLYPLDNRFVTLKDEIADNLESYISDLSNPIILVTGHSLGAAI